MRLAKVSVLALDSGMAESDPLLPRLLALLERSEGGARVYRDEEILHALPLVLLPGLAHIESEEALSFLADFFALVGVAPGDGTEQAMAKAQAFYQRFPPNPALLADIEDFVKTSLGDGSASRARFAKLLGEEPSTSVLGGGERPRGTAPGGVLGRLAAGALIDEPPPQFRFNPSSTAER